MPICTLTETEIVNGLRGDQELIKLRVQKSLYLDNDVNTAVKGYVRNRNGSLEEACQVFDFAFLQFERRVRDGRYPDVERAQNDWRATLANIGYNAWDWRKYGQADLFNFEEWNERYDPIGPIEETDYHIDLEHIFDLLKGCGENCHFIFEKEMEGYNLKEIAEMLSEILGRPISHENARTQKSKCMRNLQDML